MKIIKVYRPTYEDEFEYTVVEDTKFRQITVNGYKIKQYRLVNLTHRTILDKIFDSEASAKSFLNHIGIIVPKTCFDCSVKTAKGICAYTKMSCDLLKCTMIQPNCCTECEWLNKCTIKE